MLNNILILNKEVLIYNPFIINRNWIFIINDFKILILMFLNKGNFNNFIINDIFIKFKVIIKNKVLIILNYKLNLLKTFMFFFNENVIFYKERIINLKTNNVK